MDPLSTVVGLAVGLGVAIYFIIGHSKTKAELSAAKVKADESDDLKEEIGELRAELAERNIELKGVETKYQEQRAGIEQQQALLEKAKAEFKEAFDSLASKALQGNQEQFLKLADQAFLKHSTESKGELEKRKQAIDGMLKPMKVHLEKIGEQNQEMERRRSSAYGELMEQVKNLGSTQVGLQKETNRLVKALQDPGSAGSWGEMVLERVLEMAGLQEHVTFTQQDTIEQGRPDAIVRLPHNRVIVIDSKAPMKQYLEALETDQQETSDTLLKDHAKKVEDHARVLSKRSYSELSESPDFTVMFIPSEAAFRSALENRPGLIENAMDQHVILATPSTLLALMKAVEYGWQQEKLADNMKEVQEDGKKLYDALATLANHYAKLGGSLKSTVNHYNSFVGSMERSVLPAARRLADQGVATKKAIDAVEPQDSEIRDFVRPELTAPPESDALPFEE
jgi:DNA recombination protein RmuC